MAIFALLLTITLLFAVSCTDEDLVNETNNLENPSVDYSVDGFYRVEGVDYLYEFVDGNIFTIEELVYVPSENKIMVRIFGSEFLEIKDDKIYLENGQAVFVKAAEGEEDVYVLTDDVKADVSVHYENMSIYVGAETASSSVLVGTYTLNSDKTISLVDMEKKGETKTVAYGEGYILLDLVAWVKVDYEIDAEVLLGHIRASKDRDVMSKLEGKTFVIKNPDTQTRIPPCEKIKFAKDTVVVEGQIPENNVEYGIFGNELLYDVTGSSFVSIDFRMEGDSIFLSGFEFVLE